MKRLSNPHQHTPPNGFAFTRWPAISNRWCCSLSSPSLLTTPLSRPSNAAASRPVFSQSYATPKSRLRQPISAIASFVGGTLSIFGLVLFAPLLATWAIRFGPAEYFALMLFAFAALAGVAGRSRPKALIAVGVGLFLASVGIDPNSAVPRFTFGQLELLDGMDFVVVTIGLFAVSEVFLELEKTEVGRGITGTLDSVRVTTTEVLDTAWTMIRASVVGFLVGVLPGAGGTIASFLAYSTEQRLVDKDDTFGTGDIRGVAAPEAANNAAATGAMIPLLTLGVPGSGTTAVLLGALLALGVTPGPLLIQNSPEVFWGLAASMYRSSFSWQSSSTNHTKQSAVLFRM